ncbi:MAG TPA: cyclic nucleotide-binding domain-containing protein [Leptospiraceae bacterium]|nr:cyclic nucleotide-binding domain-containing protein [Leptospiraceae bacterium]HNM06027.1 cyclic nucleotide-binding domain-containing protein [Leptospiraceae bacterium]
MSRTVVNYPKGAHIVMEGSENPGFIYILKSGEILIESKIQFIHKKLNRYYPGDCFGFVSGIMKKKHQYNLVALNECEVIRLTIDSFVEFMVNNKDTFLHFLSSNSERLRIFLNNIDQSREYGYEEILPEELIHDARLYKRLGRKDLSCYALARYLEKNFEQPKNPVKMEEAKDMLNAMDKNYKFPVVEQFADESGLIYHQGSIIFVENEPPDYFYLIKSGRVGIHKLVDEKLICLEVIGKGEIFGEMGILNSKGRVASAIAFEDCVLQSYDRRDIFEIRDAEILDKIFRMIAKRMWLASNRFYLRQIADIDIQMYLLLQILVEERLLKPKKDDTAEVDIPLSIYDLGKMIGKDETDIKKMNELNLDRNIKIQPNKITVLDKNKFLEKAEILQKKHARQMKEVII